MKHREIGKEFSAKVRNLNAEFHHVSLDDN